MKLEVKELTDSYGEFIVTDTTPAILNAIRRTLMSEVPKLALDDVTIYDNTSALFDEMVAHRLALLPVPTDLDLFTYRELCTCEGEGCTNCTVLYTLSKEGPCTVVSGDLVPAADAKLKIVDPDVPIVKLLEGQRIMLECGAVLGEGRRHAKWQSVVAVGYQELPTLEIGKIPADTIDKMRITAPADAITFEGTKVKVVDLVKAATYLASVKKRVDHDLTEVKVGRDTSKWIFRVETDGAINPGVAVRKAISLLMDKLKQVESEAVNAPPVLSA